MHSERKINDVCREAIDTYGSTHQITVAIEEMAELQKELCKFNRDEYFNIEAIAEEIADVEIVLREIKHIFQIDDLIKEQTDFKIDRLQQRILAKKAEEEQIEEDDCMDKFVPTNKDFKKFEEENKKEEKSKVRKFFSDIARWLNDWFVY